MLVMVGGTTDSYDKAAEALYYMNLAYGCLAGIEKVELPGSFQREANEPL